MTVLALAVAGLAGLACVTGLVALARLRGRMEAVARAEHELRGPATALELVCQRMRRDPAGRGHAAMIEAQLDRLRAGLAELEAARAGRRAEPARGAVRATDVRAKARAAFASWEGARGGGAFEWPGGPVIAPVDRGELGRALGNLLANAAEHGSGDVRVKGRALPETVRIEIRNGNGRDAGGPSAPARDPAAAVERGRGLRIARRAARRLGGRVMVQVGKRETVAVLELPRRAGGDEDVAA